MCPFLESQAGDERGQALDRLLDVRLAVLAPGVQLDGTSEEAYRESHLDLLFTIIETI